jgi:hypothetical protein
MGTPSVRRGSHPVFLQAVALRYVQVTVIAAGLPVRVAPSLYHPVPRLDPPCGFFWSRTLLHIPAMLSEYLANIASSRPGRECHSLSAAAFTFLYAAQAFYRSPEETNI